MENCNKSNKIVTISEFFQPFLLRISYITLCDLDFTYTIFTIFKSSCHIGQILILVSE